MTGIRLLIIFGTIVTLPEITNLTNACNEALCGSVVTKCILEDICNCDLATCSCCKKCFTCLGDLFTTCCSCFGLCPTLNVTNSPLERLSYVEDLRVPVPTLFNALTAQPDSQKRWKSFTYQDSKSLQAIKTENYQMENFAQKEDIHIQSLVNRKTKEDDCTVAYMSTISSLNGCKISCASLGATSLRWFHDGCCECVGQNCSNYGLNESRCNFNFMKKHQEDFVDMYDDYGEYPDYDPEEPVGLHLMRT